jgi:cold shock CspA family protein
MKSGPLVFNKTIIKNMAKSRETFGKKEKEKKKLKERKEKAEKMEERRANAKKGKSLEEMMAYVDEDGNISSTPLDPKKKKIFKQEDMQISVPKLEDRPEAESERKGVVTFFNDEKGFGFINDLQTQERVFIHINQLSEPIREHDKVIFEVERGPKGLNAVNVKKIS